MFREKTRLIDLSSDSSNDEMSDEDSNEGETSSRRALAEVSMNSSSGRPPKRRQLYVSDSEEDSEGDIIASSD